MISQPVLLEAPPSSPLRLLAADVPRGRPPTLSRRSTLSDVYHWAFKPIWLAPKQSSEQTYSTYEESLEHWKRLAPAVEGDREPMLEEIDDYVVSRFMTRLADMPGNKPGTKLAIATIRKHSTNLNKLLAFAGPRSRSRNGYKNLGLLDLPPLVDKPSPDVHAPDGDFTFEEVQAMWRAAEQMQAPQRLAGITPAVWWRAMLTVVSCTGLRRGQLLGLDPQNLSGAYIRVLSGRSKGRRGKLQYLPPAALAALASVQREGERFFVWPHYRRSKKDPSAPPVVNLRHLDLQLEKLARLAGIPEARRFGWNGFRKLVGTLSFDIGGSAAAQAVLGHTKSGTAMAHYVSGLSQSRQAEAVINQLPSLKPPTDDRQRKLFD